MKLLFCNIGWMDRYNGIDDDSIKRGGAYNNKSIGHEVCNFSPINNKVYGYVRSSGKINIERLGASKKDSFIKGITVVWTAGPDNGGTVIVGWYKNATVFRLEQEIERPTQLQKHNGISKYRIIAEAENAKLLPLMQRTFLIPRAVKGGIGQSNVWYADSIESRSIVASACDFIQNFHEKSLLTDLDITSDYAEGNPRFVNHLIRERNKAVVRQKKDDVLKNTGALKCEVCGFDFSKVYGIHGYYFCEVHHLTPLHKSDGLTKTKLSDLAIICSNCHRIIHRINPMPDIYSFKILIGM
ncbi:HNH endonuclease [Aeromonas hydrophila]|uniref:HNH endonuclease n=1 Tax=Aeromonas hydrophila TaxID=644 RepID=UPI0009B8A06E|nr:HNH endonuclease [Aeromonas hydrophila]